MRIVHLIVEGIGWCCIVCSVLTVVAVSLFVIALPDNSEMERNR